MGAILVALVKALVQFGEFLAESPSLVLRAVMGWGEYVFSEPIVTIGFIVAGLAFVLWLYRLPDRPSKHGRSRESDHHTQTVVEPVICPSDPVPEAAGRRVWSHPGRGMRGTMTGNTDAATATPTIVPRFIAIVTVVKAIFDSLPSSQKTAVRATLADFVARKHATPPYADFEDVQKEVERFLSAL